MKLDLKDIPNLLLPLLQKAKQYLGFMAVLFALGLFGFVVWQIRGYATVQPSQAEIDEKLLSLRQTKIDEDAIKRIERLESTNIDIKALFDQARDNPFQE